MPSPKGLAIDVVVLDGAVTPHFVSLPWYNRLLWHLYQNSRRILQHFLVTTSYEKSGKKISMVRSDGCHSKAVDDIHLHCDTAKLPACATQAQYGDLYMPTDTKNSDPWQKICVGNSVSWVQICHHDTPWVGTWGRNLSPLRYYCHNSVLHHRSKVTKTRFKCKKTEVTLRI